MKQPQFDDFARIAWHFLFRHPIDQVRGDFCACHHTRALGRSLQRFGVRPSPRRMRRAVALDMRRNYRTKSQIEADT